MTIIIAKFEDGVDLGMGEDVLFCSIFYLPYSVPKLFRQTIPRLRKIRVDSSAVGKTFSFFFSSLCTSKHITLCTSLYGMYVSSMLLHMSLMEEILAGCIWSLPFFRFPQMRIYYHHCAGNILPACRRSEISRRTSI